MGTPHDFVNKRLVAAISSVSPREATEAFLASLADRNLRERSAFGSVAFGKHFREHPFKADAGRRCGICGQYDPVRDWAIEALVEERALGGTHFGSSLIYAAYDLECFASEKKHQPSATDVATFNRILATLAGLDDRDGAPQAAKALQGVFPANANERVKLLNVLGLSGFLETEKYRGFSEAFIPYERRSKANDYPGRTDFALPVAWWRRRDGFNTRALELSGLARFVDPSVEQLLLDPRGVFKN